MIRRDESLEKVVESLRERAKELHCLYAVDAVLNRTRTSLDEVFRGIVEVMPAGWQYPGVCWVKITHEGSVYQPPRVTETPWVQRALIIVQGETIGSLEVYYAREMPPADEGPFLREERKLIDTIAHRLSQHLGERRLDATLHRVEAAGPDEKPGWAVLFEFLRTTDPLLLTRIARRLINFLSWNGVAEAQDVLEALAPGAPQVGSFEPADEPGGTNQPVARRPLESLTVPERVFAIAATHLNDQEIVSLLQKWIKDDRSAFLLEAVEDQGTTVGDVAQALDRFEQSGTEEGELSRAMQLGLRVALIRRFLTDDPEYIETARHYVEIADFAPLVRRIITPSHGYGKLGGKSAGLFLGTRIIRKSTEYADALKNIRVPRTWYVSSDGVLGFVGFNQLQDVYYRKYLEVDQIRREYPHVIQVFKHSEFPSEIVNGLLVALDDLGERPLIVRSSSLLEDRFGSTFSGKYKSLFLANVGTRAERLNALMDAIAEVYASVLGPDPIEYRVERGLLDVNEEMAVMIQEVVGGRVGRYYLPAFAGVAFSRNEFRWSPRIKREDGLIRLVAGLGTRAVDRVTDDYPVLIAPGQPGLRVNVTADEVARYSPRRIDVIDLESRRFDTIDARTFFATHAAELPALDRIVSVYEQDQLRRASPVDFDGRADLVVTFDGLIARTPFVTEIGALLRVLQDKIGRPVDVEFASDGDDLYLLQCRSQSSSDEVAPSPIPRDVPRERVLFSARRHVSNGRVRDITHVVFVDPDAYQRIGDLADLRRVGRAVGRLNKLLPKRQFILMGPGRWGSRGDIRLGVSVSYSDISNTAMLVEIARQRGGYLPELSFGTHFFQDLVEAGIRYLPLFPDEPGVVFNEPFLRDARNMLPDLLPEFASLADVIRVVDVTHASGGLVLRILMNAEADEAIGMLAPGAAAVEASTARRHDQPLGEGDHWRWRLRMAERIARAVPAARFGVKGIYLFGSTKNATAGPASDIDLLIHVADGTDTRDLRLWLEGWNVALSEVNYLRTGYRTDGLVDVHIVTDEDVARRTSYASKIDAVTDAARPLPMTRGATDNP